MAKLKGKVQGTLKDGVWEGKYMNITIMVSYFKKGITKTGKKKVFGSITTRMVRLVQKGITKTGKKKMVFGKTIWEWSVVDERELQRRKKRRSLEVLLFDDW